MSAFSILEWRVSYENTTQLQTCLNSFIFIRQKRQHRMNSESEKQLTTKKAMKKHIITATRQASSNDLDTK